MRSSSKVGSKSVGSTQRVPEWFRAAIERLDGSTDLLREMAVITTEDIPEVMEAAETSIRRGDGDQAASHLHKLKGMLSTFESGGVTLEIQELVDLARHGEIDQLQNGFKRQRGEIDRLIDEVAAISRGL